MEENKIKNSYPRISQSPFDFLSWGVGKKTFAKIEIHLNEREKGRGKYRTLPGRERICCIQHHQKTLPFHSLIASNLAFTFLK